MSEKKPPKVKVLKVSNAEELEALLGMLSEAGLPLREKIEISGSSFNLPSETAIGGALTALHMAAHDLLVAGGVLPDEHEVGVLTAKLLARGLQSYMKHGPPDESERAAFNEEWDRQADLIAPPDPTCPCPRCRKARGG